MSRKLYTQNILRKYVQGITGRPTLQLQIKELTSSLFKGRKENYPQYNSARTHQGKQMELSKLHTFPQYSVPVVKYNRNGFRPRFRQLIYTGTAAYLVEKAKIKQRVSVSNLSDNFLILHVQCEDIKQKVGCCDYLFEALTKLSAGQQVRPVFNSLLLYLAEGIVDFESDQETMIYRAKNGHLMVGSLKLKDCVAIQFSNEPIHL
uniref:Uncharacterized protein n=1 Tax=Hucho hucho TaxID=62062 RepID=A0A4W5N1B6_9TELE